MAGPEPSMILNVNDDEHTRYVVTRALQKAGFRVEEAATGNEALAQMAKGPDLVVLDVQLPDIDGFEVCRRLRANSATAMVPVIHLSAHFVHAEDRAHGLETGSDYYLVQPVEPRELLAAVQAMLRIRRAEAEARTLARQWQATFDGIADGLCLVDPSGIVVRCNRAMGALVGRPPEDIVGRPYRDLLFSLGGEAFLDLADMDHRPGRQEQQRTIGYRSFRVTTDALSDVAGMQGYVQIFSDITDQKRAEQAEHELRESTSLIERLQREMAMLEGVARRFEGATPAREKASEPPA